MRHDPLRLAPPRHREVAVLRVPIRKIFVPITHDLVRAATVDEARQAPHQLDEVMEGRGRRRPKLLVVDIAIEGLAQSVDKYCHAANLTPAGWTGWQSNMTVEQVLAKWLIRAKLELVVSNF